MKREDFMDTCKEFEGLPKDERLERQIIMLEDILKGEGIEPVTGEDHRGNNSVNQIEKFIQEQMVAGV